MSTQVPANEYVLGDRSRRDAILQSREPAANERDPLEELARLVRGSQSRSERVLEDALPAATAPAQPKEISVWDEMKQKDELKTAALEQARAEIERLTKELADTKSGTERTIVRLSDQLDAANAKATSMEDQRNKFADYTMVLAERLKNIDETSLANSERAANEAMAHVENLKRDAGQLTKLIGEARTLAATTSYQQPREPRPAPEGLRPDEDRPSFLDRPRD